MITSKMNLVANKFKNITSNIKLNTTLDDYILEHYDDVMWSIDKLQKVTPDINWDKIFLGLFGKTNITEKVLAVDTNFVHHINDVIKELDKR